MVWKRKDIREMWLQDQARGKRHPRGDPDRIQERKDTLRTMKTLLELNDEEEFIEALITDHGLAVDSEEYRRAVMIWRMTRKVPSGSF